MMLKGRVAVVTGSTSGIGLGVARALAEQGASVMVNGLGAPDAIAAAVRDVAAHGVPIAYNGADMSKPDEIAAMIRQASRELGAVDILVNNAGIQFTAPVEEFPVDRWDAILSINLSASFHGIRAVLPSMRQRNRGRIVNIASTHGLVASVHKAAYVAAKHGLLGLTKVVALETATTGITCNAICPGWVFTPLVARQIDDLAAREGLSATDAKQRLLAEKQPSQEFATPEQIGAADRRRRAPRDRPAGSLHLRQRHVVRADPRRSSRHDGARRPGGRCQRPAGELDHPRQDGARHGRRDGSRLGRPAGGGGHAAHRQGRSKIVPQCRLPLTSVRSVDLVVTELAVIAFPGGRATVLETGPGVEVGDVLAATEARLEVSADVRPMRLGAWGDAREASDRSGGLGAEP